MQGELARIHDQVGTTFVFVTHDQEEALSMATRIAVMSLGRVVQVGTPRDIYYHPVDRFVADFIGESNFLKGTVEAHGSNGYFAFADAGRVPVTNGTRPGPATLMVRPEALEVGPIDSAPDAALKGTISQVAFMGNHTRITVDTAAGALVVHRSHSGGVGDDAQTGRPGEEACVWWPIDMATVLESPEGDGNDESG
mgnify:CR=1 FL=1